MPREHCGPPESTGVHHLPEKGPPPLQSQIHLLLCLEMFVWGFSHLLVYSVPTELRSGLFLLSEICRLPARCFLGVCPQDPPGGMDGNGKATQSSGTPTPPVMLPVPHTPNPHLHMHTGPHTSTRSNMHTHAPVTGLSRTTSQPVPGSF